MWLVLWGDRLAVTACPVPPSWSPLACLPQLLASAEEETSRAVEEAAMLRCANEAAAAQRASGEARLAEELRLRMDLQVRRKRGEAGSGDWDAGASCPPAACLTLSSRSPSQHDKSELEAVAAEQSGVVVSQRGELAQLRGDLQRSRDEALALAEDRARLEVRWHGEQRPAAETQLGGSCGACGSECNPLLSHLTCCPPSRSTGGEPARAARLPDE